MNPVVAPAMKYWLGVGLWELFVITFSEQKKVVKLVARKNICPNNGDSVYWKTFLSINWVVCTPSMKESTVHRLQFVKQHGGFDE